MIGQVVMYAAILLGGEAVAPGPAKRQTVPRREATLTGETAVSDPTTDQGDDKGLKLLPIEENIIRFTNAERQRYGLPALEPDPGLMESAREHAIWMTRNQVLRHTSRPVAENIAMGQRSSREVVQSWMSSPGHRTNILHRGYRFIGVAAYRTARGTIFWCQQFRR